MKKLVLINLVLLTINRVESASAFHHTDDTQEVLQSRKRTLSYLSKESIENAKVAKELFLKKRRKINKSKTERQRDLIQQDLKDPHGIEPSFVGLELLSKDDTLYQLGIDTPSDFLQEVDYDINTILMMETEDINIPQSFSVPIISPIDSGIGSALSFVEPLPSPIDNGFISFKPIVDESVDESKEVQNIVLKRTYLQVKACAKGSIEKYSFAVLPMSEMDLNRYYACEDCESYDMTEPEMWKHAEEYHFDEREKGIRKTKINLLKNIKMKR